MADVDTDQQQLPDETEPEPLPADASLDALFERSPDDRQRWIEEHPAEWGALKEQARPHVSVAFDPKQLEALTTVASESPADQEATIRRAIELLGHAHERDGALELEAESLRQMKERVAGLTGRGSVPTGDGGPRDLLQRGAIAEAQRDLAELEAMVAVVESALIEVPWRSPTKTTRRQYTDRFGDLVTEEGGIETGRYTPAEVAEIVALRAEAKAESDDYTSTGTVTPDDVRGWDIPKRVRFQLEYPQEWDLILRGLSASGIKRSKKGDKT